MTTLTPTNGFPVNLIMAVTTASATIFVGFLPTKSIRTPFFARETLKAALAWVLVALMTPPSIMHYPIFFALLCGGSWWKFSRDHALSGKMWLSIASGLGISIGVMLLLATTPQAYPPGLAQPAQTLLLVSIYLGGATIGLAYTSALLAMNVSTSSGVTSAIVRRYVGLLVILVVARAVVLMGMVWLVRGFSAHDGFTYETLFALGDAVVMPGLAWMAWRATRFSSRILPTRFLFVLCAFGFGAEILARFLVL